MQVTLQNVTKRFDSTTAVDNLSVTFPAGELIAVLGPSGCGKSTVLNMLCGITPVTEGRILFGDTDVTDLPPQQRDVGLVFQSYALYPHMTVAENIGFPLETRDLSPEEQAERVREIAATVGIEDLLDRKPAQLSGGQQQRVAIARALVRAPRLLLLDEPLSNLDARLRLQLREEILRIQRKTGVTTLFVTHDRDEAAAIADRILLLRDGCLRQFGTPETLYNDPADLFTADFFADPAINRIGGILTAEGFLPDGQERPIPLPRVEAAGTRCLLALRPEALQPAEDGPIEALVLSTYTTGRDTFAHLACAGSSVTVRLACGTAIAAGSTVRCRLEDNGVFLFYENGVRIK